MLLRASSQAEGNEVDMGAITADADGAEGGVTHARALRRFVDAVLVDPSDLEPARAQLVTAVGHDGMVDAAGVVANFERMNRIADATGTPLDGMSRVFSAGIREELGLHRFAAGQHDRPGALGRGFANAVSGVALRAMNFALRLRRRS